MQCVILAAGKGTRMEELTKNTPKPLLKVKGKAILQWNLEALPEEIDEVILVVGYLGEKIRERFGNKYVSTSPAPSGHPPHAWGGGNTKKMKITYVEQKELKGTAHALWACKDVLKDRFLVFYGDDIYSKADLVKLVKEPLSILASESKSDVSDNRSPATVKISEQGDLMDIVERQPLANGTVVNAGAYVLDTRIFNYPMKSAGIPTNEYGLPQTFLQMAKDGAKFKVINASKWKKVVGSEDLK